MTKHQYTEEEAQEILSLLNDFEAIMRRVVALEGKFDDFSGPKAATNAAERLPEKYRAEIVGKVALIEGMLNQ